MLNKISVNKCKKNQKVIQGFLCVLHHINKRTKNMMQIPTYIDKLIFDYLSGDLSDKNRMKLEQLLAKSEELREYKNRLEEIWNGESPEALTFNAKNAFYKFKQRVVKEMDAKRNRKMITLKPILKIAASIAIILSIGYGSFQIGYRVVDQDSPVTVSCLSGENATLTLPDGSTVWLNSESSLTYYNVFNKGKRDVFLKGEAFFNVESNKKNPFTVNAANMQITATGTQFNVMAYSNEKYVQACLIEGIVRITAGNKNYQMSAGEVVKIDKLSRKMIRSEIQNEAVLIGWRNGKLVFKDEPLSSLIRKFERFYNVNIKLEDGIESIRFSGTLQYESIDELLGILKDTQDIIANKDGNKITLSLGN